MSEKPEIAKRVERPWGISDLPADATRDISAALTGLLADVFALVPKDKKFPLAYERVALPRLSSSAR